MNQLEAHSAQNIESVGTLYVMKSRRLKDVVVDSVFKSKDLEAQQKEDLFPLVREVLHSEVFIWKITSVNL